MRGIKKDSPGGWWFIPGSNIWPSDDKKDSPVDVYECKQCGYKIRVQFNGSFLIPPTQSPEEFFNAKYNRVNIAKLAHREQCELIEKMKAKKEEFVQ